MAGDQPAPQGADSGDSGDEGQESIGEIITETDKNLATLAKMAQGSQQMPPELQKGFAAVSAQFRSLVQGAMQAMEGGGAQPAGGTESQMAGGNASARPMSMGG